MPAPIPFLPPPFLLIKSCCCFCLRVQQFSNISDTRIQKPEGLIWIKTLNVFSAIPKSGQVSAEHWKGEYSWSLAFLKTLLPNLSRLFCTLWSAVKFILSKDSRLMVHLSFLPEIWAYPEAGNGVSIAASSSAAGLLLTTSSSNFVLAGFLQGSRLQEADLFS